MVTVRPVKRRGTSLDPPNRFERLHVESEPEWDDLQAASGKLQVLPTELYVDRSKSVVTENDSPDINFRYSLNPYRGCEHGCTYCYARPTHELLGWSAGLDFERRILVKKNAPALLKEFLKRPGYECEPIVLSGVTDPYQPAERRLRISRQCLEVMLDFGQPVELISKSRLLLRDMDVIKKLGRRQLVQVSVAVTTLDESLQREMEPRASSPAARLMMIERLAEAGIPVRLLIAPMIPGLTDSEMPAILEAAAKAGAHSASYVLLRLPFAVKEVFLDWLNRVYPAKRVRIESRIREFRNGKLNDPQFGSRMRGTGPLAEQAAQIFAMFSRKWGLNNPMPILDRSQFHPPSTTRQLMLFD